GAERPDAHADLSQIDGDINMISHKARWDTLRTFQMYSDYDSYGIATNGAHFYVSTWDTTWFFKYEMNGLVIDAFEIESVKYIRDMTFVPSRQHFFGVHPDSSVIYEMDFYNHTLVRTIPIQCTGVSAVRHISYDGALDNGKGGFWLGGFKSMGAVDMEGHQLVAGNQISANWTNIFCYGTAYDRSEFFNPKLWVTGILHPNGDSSKPIPFVKAFDIETRTLSDDMYQVDYTGMTGWQVNNTFAGGACAYTENGMTYLATVFQIGEYYDTNLGVVFELNQVGIDEQSKDSQGVELLPNPVQNQCVLNLNGFEAREVNIYDALGKLVFTQNVDTHNEHSVTLDVSALHTGLYTVLVSNLQEIKTIKMLKR
ncbi:MAG: hypothetical protein CSB02_01055, partial [Bacteroidia bacterium]